MRVKLTGCRGCRTSLNNFIQGVATIMQSCHNCPANRIETLPKKGRAVKRPLRKADVAGAWAGLNGA